MKRRGFLASLFALPAAVKAAAIAPVAKAAVAAPIAAPVVAAAVIPAVAAYRDYVWATVSCATCIVGATLRVGEGDYGESPHYTRTFDDGTTDS